MKLIKLRKLLAKESLSRTRKRIRSAIESDNNTRVIRCVILDGLTGYKRDKQVYKVS